MAKDLYQILGVKKDVGDDELRKAYRKLARKFHPDVNPGDAAAEARFKEVSAAYDVLSDKKKRKAYDEFGEDSLKGGFDPGKAREYRSWQKRRSAGARPFQEEGFDFDLGDLFGFASGGPGRGRGRMRGQDVRAAVDMDLRQAILGGEVTLEVPGKPPVTVRIPPGADSGSVIRLKGRGAPGPQGGEAGDLLIETRVAPHPLLRRDGLDLTMRVPVTLEEAYAGGKIEVPTFTGAVTLTIPPRSQTGQRLRLRGKGVTRGKRSGDLYIELEPRLPDSAGPEIAEALKKTSSGYSQPVRAELAL